MISDGADWRAKGDEALGEMVYGVAEPVSLMEDLAMHMNVRLHALGISSREIFDAWFPTATAYPNQTPSPAIVCRITSC